MIKDELFVFNFVAMTTPCEVQIYDNNPIRALNCFETIKSSCLQLEKKYNFFDKNSYLNKTINNRKRNKINIDELTYNILEKIRAISLQTSDVFDISMGTIKKCYEAKSLQELNNSKALLINKMGPDTWHLKDGKIHFKYKETKLDLGGVIKEYSVDLAAKICRDFNIKSALINFGGDIYALGVKPDGTAFNIGIKNPNNPSENLLNVNISNQALTTSASYERKNKIEDKIFSHILSKNTMEEDILSATVISDSVLESGVYSTSFMINSSCVLNEDIKVVLIDKELNLHQNLIS